MIEVHLGVLSLLLSVMAVQAVPWWSDIGAAHGVRAVPLTLTELAGDFYRRATEGGARFPWRSLRQSDDSNTQPLPSQVPAFSVLDDDQDGAISPQEWDDYLEKLQPGAFAIVSTTSDPVANMLLYDIASFHYDNLRSCIRDRLAQCNTTEFEEISAAIQAHCYVKFRYSLFAGPPPFEMIAMEKKTVSSHEVKIWFTRQVDIARRDFTSKRVFNVTEEDESHVKELLLCMQQELNPSGDMVLDRNDFYQALTAIMRCAEAQYQTS